MLVPSVSRGYYEIAKLLLKRPATNVNMQDESGSTALMVLCSMATPGLDEEHMVRLLLMQRGIDTNMANNYGRTALMKACLAGHEPLVQLMIRYDPVDVVMQGRPPDLTLHRASPEGRTSSVAGHPYQHRGTIINSRGSCDPITVSPSSTESSFAINQAANVNLKDNNGDSALHLALSAGHMPIAMALFQHNDIDTNASNIYGRTILMRAAFEGHEPIVQHLLQLQATDLDQQDKQGDTALNLAAFSGHTSIARLLLQGNDTGINICNKDGSTALMIASFQGHEPVVRELLRHPTIDINLQDSEGDSALMEAARNGHFAVVGLLLNYPGVDAELHDENRQTALQMAISKGHEKTVQLLQSFRTVVGGEARSGEARRGIYGDSNTEVLAGA